MGLNLKGVSKSGREIKQTQKSEMLMKKEIVYYLSQEKGRVPAVSTFGSIDTLSPTRNQ
jgi:hypothetical protein